MADRFYKDIELPDLVDSSGLAAPDNGFIQVYGKSGKLAYMDSTGVETVVDMTEVSTHVGQADPHPQYLTQAEGDALYQPIGGGAQVVNAFLTATQATTDTEEILNGFTFNIPPGKTATINAILIFTAESTRTGAFLGVRVTNPAGADGDLSGAWQAYVNLSSAAAATGLSDGDVLNIAPNTTSPAGTGALGTASTAGNNSGKVLLILTNTSTNTTATASIVFSSESAGKAVTAQIGTIATCILS